MRHDIHAQMLDMDGRHVKLGTAIARTETCWWWPRTEQGLVILLDQLVDDTQQISLEKNEV